jgi:hypothetical protein
LRDGHHQQIETWLLYTDAMSTLGRMNKAFELAAHATQFATENQFNKNYSKCLHLILNGVEGWVQDVRSGNTHLGVYPAT